MTKIDKITYRQFCNFYKNAYTEDKCMMTKKFIEAGYGQGGNGYLSFAHIVNNNIENKTYSKKYDLNLAQKTKNALDEYYSDNSTAEYDFSFIPDDIDVFLKETVYCKNILIKSLRDEEEYFYPSQKWHLLISYCAQCVVEIQEYKNTEKCWLDTMYKNVIKCPELRLWMLESAYYSDENKKQIITKEDVEKLYKSSIDFVKTKNKLKKDKTNEEFIKASNEKSTAYRDIWREANQKILECVQRSNNKVTN